jgi:uncharacterized membrane protein YkvA (DUF1232 family)
MPCSRTCGRERPADHCTVVGHALRVWAVGVWVAVALGVVVLAVVTLGLAMASRLLPPGRTREVAGFLPNCIVLLRRLRRDAGLPRRARVVLGAALAYLLSPVQLIPNFIPVIGQTDDLAVVTAALRYACRRLPRERVVAAWPGDPAYLDRLLGAPVPALTRGRGDAPGRTPRWCRWR